MRAPSGKGKNPPATPAVPSPDHPWLLTMNRGLERELERGLERGLEAELGL